MKIALYNLTTTTKVGGVESFVWDLSRELVRRGHAVTIIGGIGTQREHIPSVRIITYPFISRHFWQRFPLLNRAYAEAKLLERLTFAIPALPELLRGGYDIVHLQKPYDMAPALLARLLGGPRVVLGCHGEDFYPGDRWLARFVDAAVSCSAFNAYTIAARYGIEPTVIYNGFDPELFCLHSGVDAQVSFDSATPVDGAFKCRFIRRSSEWGKTSTSSPSSPPSPPVHGGESSISPPQVAVDTCYTLLYVGRLMPWKGVDVAIQALVHIPDATLLIAGAGQEEIALRELAMRMGVGHRVRFLGTVSRTALPHLYRTVDLLLATSFASETFGISLVEAQACGLPVVATRFGGFPEVVDEGRTGLLVPPRDVHALAHAVTTLLNDPPRRAAMAAAAPAWASQFIWPAVVDRVEAVYRGVCS